MLLRRVENVRCICVVVRAFGMATPPDSCKDFTTERIIIDNRSTQLLIVVVALISTLMKITLQYVCIDYSTLFSISFIYAQIYQRHTIQPVNQHNNIVSQMLLNRINRDKTVLTTLSCLLRITSYSAVFLSIDMATNITWHSSHVKVCIQRIYCVGRM